MQDPNMRDFYGRIDRIEKTHQSGGGFEATGTLGMAYYNSLKQERRHGTWVFPVVLVLATVLVIKASVLASIGATAYAERIATLQSGGLIDKIGGYVLQADPLTVKVVAMLGNVRS